MKTITAFLAALEAQPDARERFAALLATPAEGTTAELAKLARELGFPGLEAELAALTAEVVELPDEELTAVVGGTADTSGGNPFTSELESLRRAVAFDKWRARNPRASVTNFVWP